MEAEIETGIAISHSSLSLSNLKIMFLGAKKIFSRKKLLFYFSSLKQPVLHEILNFQYAWQTNALLLVNIRFFVRGNEFSM